MSASFASAAAAAAAAAASAGKERGRGSRGAPSSSSSSVHSATASANSSQPPSHQHANPSFLRKDILRLIKSLNRPEDQGAFAVDVAATYPDLKAQYEAACPHKMTLEMMRQRAQEDLYVSTEPQAHPIEELELITNATNGGSGVGRRSTRNSGIGGPVAAAPRVVVGNSMAESLELMRLDVELIVRNCLTFNAQVAWWVDLANSFAVFAHGRIDAFIVEHYPMLQGTQTGVQLYASKAKTGVAPSATVAAPVVETVPAVSAAAVSQEPSSQSSSIHQQQQQQQLQPPPQKSGASPISAAPAVTSPLTAASSAPAPKQPRAAAPTVVVVETCTPVVERTALQPEIRIPAALKERILDDHVKRDTLRARLLLLHSSADKDNGSSVGKKRPRGEENEEGGENGTIGVSASENFSADPSLSCAAVLNAFRSSVSAFFEKQRTRPDFTDAFAYSVSEEKMYYDCITVIEEQFQRIFPTVLLYAREKADVCVHIASVESEKKMKVDSNNPSDLSGICSSAGVSVSWGQISHLCYLVRFLVHFPQLGLLACTSSGSTGTPSVASGSGAAARGRPPRSAATPLSGSSSSPSSIQHGGSVRILSSATEKLMTRVTRIVEELLLFVANYEEAATGKILQVESATTTTKEVKNGDAAATEETASS